MGPSARCPGAGENYLRLNHRDRRVLTMQSVNGGVGLRVSDCTLHPTFRQHLVSLHTSSTLWGSGCTSTHCARTASSK